MSIGDIEIEKLRYPIGKPNVPLSWTKGQIEDWIGVIEKFPLDVFNSTHELTNRELSWAYRPEGWSIRQLVHHCADSHMNSLIRFKWALTEDTPTIKAYYEDRWAILPDSMSMPLPPAQALLDGLHERWVYLLRSLSEDDLNRSFVHPDTGKKTPLWKNIGLYSWHCQHHLAHIHLALEFEGRFRQT